MLDFLIISTRSTKRGVIEIYPKFIIKQSNDLMIRGGDFYAIWDEEVGLWSTNEQDALRLIDNEIDIYKADNEDKFDGAVRCLHLWDAESGMIDKWHKYLQKQMRDNFHMLDEKVIFSNESPKKRDYASKKLNYPLEKCETPAYDELIGTLYFPEEREKIEWAIGSIVTGDSKTLQKFLVLYGAAGTGKSTVLNIIQQLFDGYYSVFDAKALGSSNNSFALEAFKTNPLVAIQHDGDLSKIEDNTRLNSLVSHELMTVNEKFKSTYSNRFKSFLFMGTNKPVKITDGKSGLIRRLIDVSPSSNKVPQKRYSKLVKQIEFELPGIAYHCKEVYLSDPEKYDEYIPRNMLGATNHFYNYVLEQYGLFKKEDSITLARAWDIYNDYCDRSNISFKYSRMIFKEELKNYFRSFEERVRNVDGDRIRSLYSGFRTEKFEDIRTITPYDPEPPSIIFKKYQKSVLDKIGKDYPAQYANERGTPQKKWSDVTTTLKDINPSELHYVKLPKNHIVIDFDIPDEDGNKSLERNLAEASKWPATYAEYSKSGSGIHLHYIYDGDVTKLKKLYDDHIEIKVFTGNSSLRRKVTKSNGLDISVINSGLPLKGEKEMGVDFSQIKSEKELRTRINKTINKEYENIPGTKVGCDFIKKVLDDAYESGIQYDVSDMRGKIFAFAANSTNQSEYCMKLVGTMQFKSENAIENTAKNDSDLIFYDVEVFPNVFIVCWKAEGKNKSVVKMINPSPQEIEDLMTFNLVGFNCRRYDNHILYARYMGYNEAQLYDLSQRIISGDRNAFFREAYNVSYTDVYDYSSKKQSLKKWEIELGIHHQENSYPWDEPLPEEHWMEVVEYCANDVIATEAVHNARKADFTARRILADVADLSVNSTTNSLTTKIIFGNDKNPQDEFNYRNLAEPCDDKPYFEGYSFRAGVSTYRGEEVGEGGYVYAEPGIYGNVALLDIASMHPTSIVQEELFGRTYTKNFNDILNARIAIKHKDFETAKAMLNGKLAPYLEDESTAKDLAQALKIAINSVYGLTSAKFDNPFRDPRNKDNIVAKRGALFMIDLKHAVKEKGYDVAHIKTDSIKIPNADEEIINFVMEFGKRYGYTFEHEATYDRICLVNDAVYIAATRNSKGELEWTATGTQFQVPYVFKTLFSHEPVEFGDLCETKSVTTALYLNLGTDEEPHRHFVGKVGLFCPVTKNGGYLQREKDGKYYAATGTKGYLWREAELVDEKDIDKSYYQHLAEEAIETISKYGSFDWFVDPESDCSKPF